MDNKGQSLSPLFLRSLLAQCDHHLEHTEPRVRSLVASTLGALTRAGDASSSGQGGEAAECTGLATYAFFRERLAGAISTNFERTKETIRDAISGAENVAVDDTSGWKALETSLLALKVQLSFFIAVYWRSLVFPSQPPKVFTLAIVFSQKGWPVRSNLLFCLLRRRQTLEFVHIVYR